MGKRTLSETDTRPVSKKAKLENGQSSTTEENCAWNNRNMEMVIQKIPYFWTQIKTLFKLQI